MISYIIKSIIALLIGMPTISHALTYEKLPSEYLITYGKEDAKLNVTYLFSIYCPNCLEFIRDDFPKLKEKYIDSGQVKWVWHPFPNPQKPLTYQAMLCWEKLSSNQRRLFLENCAHYLNDKNLYTAPDYFRQLMKFFGKEVPDLYSRQFLLDERGKKHASEFISQKMQINIPSIEINGEYSGKYPSFAFIENEIEKKLNSKEGAVCVKASY